MKLSSDQQLVLDAMLEFAQGNAGDLMTVGGYGGCLDGNTLVIYARGSRVARRKIALRDLYLKFNGKRGSGRGTAQRWVPHVPTYLESYFPDGRIARNRVLAVFDSGEKKVIELQFSDGWSLIVTKDHPIATPSGEFVAAGDLRKDSEVLARGSLKMAPGKGRRSLADRPPRVIITCKYHPLGGRKKIVSNGVSYFYARVARARLVFEADMNKLPYDEFIRILKKDKKRAKKLQYLPANIDVHHKDEDTLNDTLDNLEALDAREHARRHGLESGWKYFNREYTRVLKIKAIKPAGKRQTYDVQMTAPANNFVANGIIVHNTGKSTVVGVFAAEAKERGIRPAYVAPTGRAASVLRKKLTACGIQTTKTRGMPGVKMPPFCGTIHGLTKFPAVNPKGELVGFQSAPGLGGQYDLLVVDEASMVGGEMRAHLQSFGLPILAVGDHGQLPPVNDSAGFMENPDFKLEKVHRQAAGNPIIALSIAIRETGEMPKRLADGKHLQFLNRRDGRKALAVQLLGSRAGAAGVSQFDQAIICAYNRTRVELNYFARDCLKLNTNPIYPKKGDLVMCLKNLHALGIMNGMRGVMLSDAEQDETTPWLISGDMEFPDEELKITGSWLADRVGGMCWPGFMREKPFQTVDDFNKEVQAFCNDIIADEDVGDSAASHMKDLGWPFDFGYAMTAHKSQGSQFSHVAVWIDRNVEPDSLDYRRWLYTSCTRSTERLLVVE